MQLHCVWRWVGSRLGFGIFTLLTFPISELLFNLCFLPFSNVLNLSSGSDCTCFVKFIPRYLLGIIAIVIGIFFPIMVPNWLILMYDNAVILIYSTCVQKPLWMLLLILIVFRFSWVFCVNNYLHKNNFVFFCPIIHFLFLLPFY